MIPVMILAGGFARRLGALTTATPKSLLPIAGVPFLVHQLDGLKTLGLTDVIVLTGHLGSQIEAVIGGGHDLGMTIRYVEDGPTPRGTGGAIRAALPIQSPLFFTLYGDVLIDFDPAVMLKTLDDTISLGCMGVTAQHRERHNVEYFNHYILRYDNAGPLGAMNRIDAGVHLFHTSAFQYWPQGLTFPLDLVFQRLILAKALAGVSLAGPVQQIGTPDGLEELRALAR